MEVDLSGINERFLGADRPFERMVALYVQIYERMTLMFEQDLLLEDWDSILTSLDLMVKYLSEIKPYDLTEEFRSMRDMYVSIINDSIKEIEEVLEND